MLPTSNKPAPPKLTSNLKCSSSNNKLNLLLLPNNKHRHRSKLLKCSHNRWQHQEWEEWWEMLRCNRWWLIHRWCSRCSNISNSLCRCNRCNKCSRCNKCNKCKTWLNLKLSNHQLVNHQPQIPNLFNTKLTLILVVFLRKSLLLNKKKLLHRKNQWIYLNNRDNLFLMLCQYLILTNKSHSCKCQCQQWTGVHKDLLVKSEKIINIFI